MSNRRIHICLMVMVLVAATTGITQARDPNLVGWWKMDDGTGATAVDSSGYGNDATLTGTYQWVDGMYDGGLHLDGSTAYGEIAADPSLVVLNQGGLACMVWFKTDALDGTTQYMFQQGDLNGTGRSLLYINGAAEFCTYVGGGTNNSGFVVEAETWYHGAYIVREQGAPDSIELYINGEHQATASRGMESCEGGYFIGTHKSMATGTRWTGILDDLRLYNRDLSQGDLLAAMMNIPPESARGPEPPDGSTDAWTEVTLSWSPGQYAATHDVYLGTSFEDVENASRTNPLGVLVSEGQADMSYTPTNPLDLETTYYWRVDEVNAAPSSAIYKGAVWSFTTEPVAYAIADVNATSNTASTEGQGPENAVNGSGLGTDDTHGTAVDTMWTGTAPEGEAPYIQFEFDRVYKLHEMILWNYNMAFESFLGIGLKEVTVEYSQDGVEWTLLGDIELPQAPGMDAHAYDALVSLDGAAAKYVRITANSNFGGGTQYGLSEVRFTYIPVWAKNPVPADGTTNLDPAVALGWRPGRDALSHEVYAGTDPNALDLIATTDQAGLAENFDLGQSYYWRVDEVTADGTWTGDLWSFSTQAYVVVEDFESYDDDTEAGTTIWHTWSDGLEDATVYGGSQAGHYNSPFAEQTTVHGGGQAMPLYFNNADYSFSETKRTFATAQDWTLHGIQSLVLYVHGDLTNAAAGRLYAKINDTKVYYDSVSDVLQRAQWMLWPIDLAQVGADLSNVTSLSLGVDDAGASGILYVDDIRLYAEGVETIEPVTPDDSDPNLAAYYAFDGNADDSTGNYPGTLMGTPTFVAGLVGQAISVNGVSDYVVNSFAADEVWPAYSVSLWAKAGSLAQPQWSSVFNNNAAASDFQIDVDGTDPGNYNYRGSATHILGPVNVNDWVHLAASCDGATTDLYYNGLLVATLNVADTQFGQIAVGVNRAVDNWFEGLIDDVRVYDRALSAGEAAGLAGVTEPISTLGM